MADIPLKERRIQFNAPNANGGNSPAFRASNIAQVQPIAPAAHKAGQDAISTLQVFQKIKRQNDVARATNDLAVYKQKVSDLMNSTDIDPETGEVKGFMNRKGENAFNSLQQYQDKLSALTKEYQQQIHSYDPDIRDKFTIDSDETHMNGMQSINKYALDQTLEFQENATKAYFKDLDENTFVTNSNQIPLLKEQMLSHLKLVNPGQSDEFYNMKVNEHYQKILENSVRRINELHSNEDSYNSYKYGLGFLEKLNKDGVLSKEQLQKLGNKQNVARFNAMEYEHLTTDEDFKDKLVKAKYMDNLEKQRVLNNYLTHSKNDEKIEQGIAVEMWKKATYLDPKFYAAILRGHGLLPDGYSITQEEIQALPQHMLRLLPYVQTTYKGDMNITYLNKDAMPESLKMDIKRNRVLNNAVTYLDELLKGNEEMGFPPLPALNPEEVSKLITFYENQNKIPTPERFSMEIKYDNYKKDVKNIITKPELFSTQEMIRVGFDLEEYVNNYLPEYQKEAADLTVQLEEQISKKAGLEAQGIFRLFSNDTPQALWGPISKWWRSAGILDTNNANVRNQLKITADYLAPAHINNYSSSLFGGNRHPDAGIRETVYEVVNTMLGDEQMSVVVGIQDGESTKFIQKELPIFAMSPSSADKIFYQSRKDFIKAKQIQEPNVNWEEKYFNMTYDNFSDDDKKLMKNITSKNIIKFARLDDMLPQSQSPLLQQELGLTDKPNKSKSKPLMFGGETVNFITDTSETEALRMAKDYGVPIAHTIQVGGQKDTGVLTIKENQAYDEAKAVAELDKVDKTTFGMGIARLDSGNGKSTNYIKIIIEDNGNERPIWITVPNGENPFNYANKIDNLAGSKIYSTLKHFNGKKLVRSDVYDSFNTRIKLPENLYGFNKI